MVTDTCWVMFQSLAEPATSSRSSWSVLAGGQVSSSHPQRSTCATHGGRRGCSWARTTSRPPWQAIGQQRKRGRRSGHGPRSRITSPQPPQRSLHLNRRNRHQSLNLSLQRSVRSVWTMLRSPSESTSPFSKASGPSGGGVVASAPLPSSSPASSSPQSRRPRPPSPHAPRGYLNPNPHPRRRVLNPFHLGRIHQ